MTISDEQLSILQKQWDENGILFGVTPGDLLYEIKMLKLVAFDANAHSAAFLEEARTSTARAEKAEAARGLLRDALVAAEERMCALPPRPGCVCGCPVIDGHASPCPVMDAIKATADCDDPLCCVHGVFMRDECAECEKDATTRLYAGTARETSSPTSDDEST